MPSRFVRFAAFLLILIGLAGGGALTMRANPPWPGKFSSLSHLREGAFRGVPEKLHIMSAWPPQDPQYAAHRQAWLPSIGTAPRRSAPVSPRPAPPASGRRTGGKAKAAAQASSKILEVVADDAFGYTVVQIHPQTKRLVAKVFYNDAGKTQSVMIIRSSVYPLREALYAYPSGRLKSVAFSPAPQERYVFDASGKLREYSAPEGGDLDRFLSGKTADIFSSHISDMDAGGEDWKTWDSAVLSRRPPYERKVAQITRMLLDANHIRQNIPCIVLNDADVNAVASLNSGTIYITVSLLRYVESDDELAGVIGHELAHILLNHREANMSSFGIRLGGYFFKDESPTRFDLRQRQEVEADARGVRLAMRAGYNPEGQYRLLQKIAGQSDMDDLGATDHPGTTLRLKILKREIAALRQQATLEQQQNNRPQPVPEQLTLAFDSTGAWHAGQWRHDSARQEILKHKPLAETLLRDLSTFPDRDPDFQRHQEQLSRAEHPSDDAGKVLEPISEMEPRLRMLRYLGGYAELMAGTGREGSGYSVLFPQSRAYPTFLPDGGLERVTLCNRTEFPRTCHTASAKRRQLEWITLELSEQLVLFYTPQGVWRGYRQGGRRYDRQHQPVSEFRDIRANDTNLR